MNNTTLRVRLPLFVFLGHAAVAACVLLSSCTFGDNADVVQYLNPEEQALYVAGRVGSQACLWIVNESTSLKYILPVPPTTVSSYARGVAVDRGRVIVSGCYSTGAATIPIIWINGVMYPYPDLSTAGTAPGNGLAMKDGVFYVAAISNANAMIIVEGAPVPLRVPPGTTASFAFCVAADADHVYVGGQIQTATVHAALWIDGEPVILDNSGSVSLANCVESHMGHVYVGGHLGGNACMWVDGSLVSYNVAGTINSIQVVDGVVYASGQVSGTTGALWIGGPGNRIQYTGAPSDTTSTTVITGGPQGRMMISTGRYDDAGNMTAALWINGALIKLDAGGVMDNTEARAVALGPRLVK